MHQKTFYRSGGGGRAGRDSEETDGDAERWLSRSIEFLVHETGWRIDYILSLTLSQAALHIKAIQERKAHEHLKRCIESMFAMADPKSDGVKEYFASLMPAEKPRKIDNIASLDQLKAFMGGH